MWHHGARHQSLDRCWMRVFYDMVGFPRPLRVVFLTPLANSDTEGLYSACCEEYLSKHHDAHIEVMARIPTFRTGCPSGSTDGLIGYNCTGYEVEGQ